MVGFVVVFVTHVLLAYNLLAFGGLRNLQFIWHRQDAVLEAHPVAPRVAEVIRAARTVYLPFTHWEVFYWNLMRFNPAARYTTGGDLRLPSPDTLMLLNTSTLIKDGRLPAKLPRLAAPGLTYLGLANHDHLFAQGDLVHARFPGQSHYALFHFSWSRDAASGGINGVQSLACCVGIDPAERIEFRYELLSRVTGKRVGHAWSQPRHPSFSLRPIASDKYDTLIIEIRSIQDPDEVVRTVHELDRDFSVVGNGELTYTLTQDSRAAADIIQPLDSTNVAK
jgi:hypothetical protein